MKYTDEQYSCLRSFSRGAVWHWHRNSEQDRLMRFLLEEGLIEPRCDIKDNYYVISELGKIALSELDAQKKALQQRRKDMAKQKSEKKIDRALQLLNTLLGAVLGAALTLIVEHWSSVVVFFRTISFGN